MATKRLCDRCGGEIKPADSVTYAGMSTYKYEGKLTHELCPSCAYHLGRWLDGKEEMVEVQNGRE